MTVLDRFLQRRRIRKALPFIPGGARVLDIGTDDGALFRQARKQIERGIGIDPALNESREHGFYQLFPGHFPEALPDEGERFDAIVLLAVVEHIPPSDLEHLATSCARHLKPQGRIIVTVPSQKTDYLLAVLEALGLIDGMKLDEHHGYDASQTPSVFSHDALQCIEATSFQFGFNNLFVFEKR